jgi:hypothetical protein
MAKGATGREEEERLNYKDAKNKIHKGKEFFAPALPGEKIQFLVNLGAFAVKSFNLILAQWTPCPGCRPPGRWRRTWGRGPGAAGPCHLPQTPSPNPLLVYLTGKVGAIGPGIKLERIDSPRLTINPGKI